MLITDPRVPEPLPAKIAANLRSAQQFHPDAKQSLLTNEDITSFLRGHFDSEVFAAYDTLAPYAYRADLARYCLLLVHGGLYADVGIRFVDAVSAPPGAKIAAFRDWGISSKHLGGLANGLILAEPGQPEFKTAIDLIIAHCREQFYGASSLEPTGPVLFARALAIANRTGFYSIGELCAATPDYPRKNLVFVTVEGTLVAFNKTTGGGNISDFGLEGTNNYNDFWRKRRVYGRLDDHWRFDRSDILTNIAARTDHGIVFIPGMRGPVFFGPYVPAPPGTYIITLEFSRETLLTKAVVEAVSDRGKTLWRSIRGESLRLDETGQLSFEVALDQSVSDLEVRLRSNGVAEGCFKALTITHKP